MGREGEVASPGNQLHGAGVRVVHREVRIDGDRQAQRIAGAGCRVERTCRAWLHGQRGAGYGHVIDEGRGYVKDDAAVGAASGRLCVTCPIHHRHLTRKSWLGREREATGSGNQLYRARIGIVHGEGGIDGDGQVQGIAGAGCCVKRPGRARLNQHRGAGHGHDIGGDRHGNVVDGHVDLLGQPGEHHHHPRAWICHFSQVDFKVHGVPVQGEALAFRVGVGNRLVQALERRLNNAAKAGMQLLAKCSCSLDIYIRSPGGHFVEIHLESNGCAWVSELCCRASWQSHQRRIKTALQQRFALRIENIADAFHCITVVGTFWVAPMKTDRVVAALGLRIGHVIRSPYLSDADDIGGIALDKGGSGGGVGMGRVRPAHIARSGTTVSVYVCALGRVAAARSFKILRIQLRGLGLRSNRSQRDKNERTQA